MFWGPSSCVEDGCPPNSSPAPGESRGGVHPARAGSLLLLVLGVEPGLGSVSAVLSSVPATVVCRHITINSTGKALLFYVRNSRLSQLQTNGLVSFQKC